MGSRFRTVGMVTVYLTICDPQKFARQIRHNVTQATKAVFEGINTKLFQTLAADLKLNPSTGVENFTIGYILQKQIVLVRLVG